MGAGDIFLNRQEGGEASPAVPDAFARLRRWEPALVVLGLAILFAIVSGEAAGGRFWAEEGTFFFQPFMQLPIWRQPFHLYHGQLQLWANLFTAVAEVSGLRAAPVVTTYLSGAVIVAISAGIYLRRGVLGLNHFSAAVLIGFYWFTPQSAELWANATNTQWHAGFLTALILVAPAEGNRWPKRAMLAACGLAGLPACILALAFAIAALVERGRERRVQAGILLVLLALQAVLVSLMGDTVDRAFAFDVWSFLKAFIAQTVYSPIIGGDFLNSALHGQRLNLATSAFLYFGVLLFLAPLVIGRARRRTAVILGASLLTAGTGYWGMVNADADMAFSGMIGGRYFFTPALLNILAWLWAIESRLPAAGRPATIARAALAGLAVPLFFIHATTSPWRNVFFHGPDWSAEVRDLKDKGDRHLAIWPDGWFIDVPPAEQK